jgi:hypothetical protein
MADISDAELAGLSKTELAELRKTQAFVKSLYDDSAVGFDFRKLVKKKYPQASIPELDAIVKTEELSTGIDKRMGEIETNLSKKIDGFLDARKKEKEDSDVETFAAKIDKIAKDRGYTKEGTEKLLGLMKDRGIQDPDDAVVIFESRQPKPTPAPRQYSSRMQFISPDNKDDESFKQLMADPEQWMMDTMMTNLGNANKED